VEKIMNITELLAQFANPETLTTLSVTDKLLAGLVTTLLGVGITFSALIILQFTISWMDRLLNRSTIVTQEPTTAQPPMSVNAQQTADVQDDKELVAVITAVIALKLKTTADNIVIRNIVKIDDNSSLWNRAGIIEQMNSRL
jgi:glutaconyl-CoA/methylmalonyl-CoA decarboxylase subunit delta